MNRRLVVRLLGAIMLIEALAMLPSLAVALFYGSCSGWRNDLPESTLHHHHRTGSATGIPPG